MGQFVLIDFHCPLSCIPLLLSNAFILAYASPPAVILRTVPLTATPPCMAGEDQVKFDLQTSISHTPMGCPNDRESPRKKFQ